jgi:amino acid transporter
VSTGGEIPGGEAHFEKTLGRWDLVLLKIVAIVNLNNVPATAVYGWFSLALWFLAFATFFVPEAIAVLVLSRRYPGEGGIYVWIRNQFGGAHGFLAGWCYWATNLFYVPVLLVYMAGIFAYAGGEAQAAGLAESRGFVATLAFGWLVFMAIANIRGAGVGKWIHNIGGGSSLVSVVLVVVAAGAALAAGVHAQAPAFSGIDWETATSFAVMCNALVGVELASTMGDEIRDPDRDLGPAVAIAGTISILSYAFTAAAVLVLVPGTDVGVLQGIMQAISIGANAAGASWLIAPLAVLMGLAIGGAASAWFAGSARVPFVAGLTSALPESLGRVHPIYKSPYVALLVTALLCALFTLISFAGSSVNEAYQVLLKSAVVMQMIPFTYLFLTLTRTDGISGFARGAGWVGLATTLVGMVVAFLPTSDVTNVWLFEMKLVAGVAGPVGLGWLLHARSTSHGVSA